MNVVYQIKLNDKLYIGSTARGFEKRKYEHLTALRENKHYSKYLQRAYNKYGEGNIAFSILEEISDVGDILKAEQKYLDELKPEYNTCKIAGSRLGTKCSEETKLKISKGQFWRDGMGYAFNSKKRYVCTYSDLPLPKELTDKEVGRLCWLSKKMYSDTNLLAKKHFGYIEPLSRKEIQEIVGLCRSKFSSFWKKMQEYNVIGTATVDNETYYCFNPLFFNSSDYIKPYIYAAFQNEFNERVKREEKKAEGGIR